MGQFKSFDDLLNCNSHFGSQFDKDVENDPGREYQPLFKFNHLTNHKNHELQYDPNATPDPIYNRGYNPYGPGRTWVGRDISLEGVAAIEWEPVLEVNESNWDDVFDDPYNSDNFVFGFSEISQNATKDPTYPGYLNLYKNNFAGETTVLENALVKPMFITHEATFSKTTDTDGGIVRENIIKECTNFGDIRQMIGRKWYLSINIKLLEDNQQMRDDETVLTIELPGEYVDDEGSSHGFSIAFNGIPSYDIEDSDEYLNDYNDTERYTKIIDQSEFTDPSFNRPEIIEIKKGHLGNNGESTTISAVFFTDGSYIDEFDIYKNTEFLPKINNVTCIPNNPYFPGTGNPQITDLDIVVNYKDNLDIGINWIRIENESAKMMFRELVYDTVDVSDPIDGYEEDGYARNFAPKRIKYSPVTYPSSDFSKPFIRTIKPTIESYLYYIDTLNMNLPEPKFFPFKIENAMFEYDHPMLWRGLRYLNKISNGIFINRDATNMSNLFFKYTGADTRHTGISYGMELLTAVPYINGANLNHHELSIGFKYGDKGRDWSSTIIDENIILDPDALETKPGLYSHYETFLKESIWYDGLETKYSGDFYDAIENFDKAEYVECMKASESIQGSYEYSVYPNYLDKSLKHDELLFNPDNKWICNFYLGSNYSPNPISNSSLFPNDQYLVLGNFRPKTSEEIRLLWFTVVLAGAKGLIYDGPDDITFDFDKTVNIKQWANGQRLSELVIDDELDVYDNFHGIGNGLELDGTDINSIESFEAGGDYIIENDPWRYDYFMDLDAFSDQLGDGVDNIYVGRRSSRIEIFKNHLWLDEIEDELMDMQLLGW